MIEALKQLVNDDVALVRRGRFSHHDISFGGRPGCLADRDLRRPDCFGNVGPLCDAIVIVCAARGGSGMGKILELPAAARLA